MTRKLKQNLIVLIVFAAMAGFVYFKYLITPLDIKNREALSQLQQAESKLSEMKRRAMELPKLQAEMRILETEVTELEKSLPRNKEIPDIIRTITRTAQRYHLKIQSFSPAPMLSQPNFNEVPFQITLQGSYHSLAHFLAELGQQTRILNAKNINISSSGGKDNETTINATFTLVAYIFKG